MSENLCPICLSTIDEDNNDMYKLECNHFFHSKCIMDWFRAENSNGKCPCCNDTPQNINTSLLNTYYYDNNLIEQRCAAIRRYGNKKEAPLILKKRIEKLKKLEKDLKEISKEKKEFIDESREILKRSKKLDSDVWKYKHNIQKQKYNIVCSFKNMIIPDNIIFL